MIKLHRVAFSTWLNTTSTKNILGKGFLRQGEKLGIRSGKRYQIVSVYNLFVSLAFCADTQGLGKASIALCNSAFVRTFELLSGFASSWIRGAFPTLNGLTYTSAGAGYYNCRGTRLRLGARRGSVAGKRTWMLSGKAAERGSWSAGKSDVWNTITYQSFRDFPHTAVQVPHASPWHVRSHRWNPHESGFPHGMPQKTFSWEHGILSTSFLPQTHILLVRTRQGGHGDGS